MHLKIYYVFPEKDYERCKSCFVGKYWCLLVKFKEILLCSWKFKRNFSLKKLWEDYAYFNIQCSTISMLISVIQKHGIISSQRKKKIQQKPHTFINSFCEYMMMDFPYNLLDVRTWLIYIHTNSWAR